MAIVVSVSPLALRQCRFVLVEDNAGPIVALAESATL